MGLFSKINRIVVGIGNWWWVVGTGGALWVVLAWVSSHLAPVSHYGWAADVLAGVLFASIAMAGAGFLLSGWRYFRPLDQRRMSQVISPVADENTNANALEIRFDDSETYSQVDQRPNGLVVRTYSFRLYNLGNGFVTETAAFIANTSPALPEGSIKVLASQETLPLGQ